MLDFQRWQTKDQFNLTAPRCFDENVFEFCPDMNVMTPMKQLNNSFLQINIYVYCRLLVKISTRYFKIKTSKRQYCSGGYLIFAMKPKFLLNIEIHHDT